MSIARIALDIPLATLFDYTVDAAMDVAVGQRVIVPFGTRQMLGVVMECVASSDMDAAKIKPITRALQDCAPLSHELLRLLNFCSEYYRYPIGQTVLPALPTRLRSDEPIVVKSIVSYRLSAQGAALDLSALPKNKKVQLRILNLLLVRAHSKAELKAVATTVSAALKLLVSEGWVEEFDVTQNPHLNPLPQAGEEANEKCHLFNGAHTLTVEQQVAVDAVTSAQNFQCFLLHGITGSGKTEVYVHLMHHALQRDGQVLLLVPEINLTPQLEDYFRSRFPDVDITSLHSGLSERARLENWLDAQQGRAKIILGTRLSVFAELPKLALIIVDEEHDASFKQQDGLRYSARDVAIFRASQRGVPIVLGSATPSLESFHNAQTGRYKMLTLQQRANASARLPTVRCIHTKQNLMKDGISEILLREIELRITRGEQSLLFINRRGYAPVLMCGGCGWLSDCKNCAGKMVLHLQDQRLRCHHCGYQIRPPKVCPDCASNDLHPIGSGTQRIEEVLQERFPTARILRVDRDSTRNKRAWQTMREQIHANEVDILVGTQMLAKGHDFPALTLVGVLNPDSALYSSDFRASEKLYAQLAQVSGRAGRADKAGEVIIQTEFPDHPLYRALQRHDFNGFAAEQLAERDMAGFPPFHFQAILRAEGKVEGEVYAYLNQARTAAMALAHPVEVLGVVPAALARRANHVRAHLLIQASSRRALQTFLRDWQFDLDAIPHHKLRCALDIDPLEF
ncbi:MAG: primosomal protein N' [Sideroxydans sp.]|nr:primosomal protein N' [Sideroxydans sp.]